MEALVSRPADVMRRPEEMLVTLRQRQFILQSVKTGDSNPPVSNVVPLTSPDVDQGLMGK